MNVLKSKIAGVVAAVVLAGAGTALLVGYVRGAEDRALEGEQPTSVYVVSAPIARGTRAEEIGERVRRETVPVKVKAAGAVTSLSSLSGQVAVVDLVPGEQLVTTRFATEAAATTDTATKGLLQVTVALDAVRALGGTIRAGDTVGVLASFTDDPVTTHLILQKVRVTGVRTEAGAAVRTKASDTAITGTVMVTLALDAPAVEKVVFAAEHGSLWLSAQPLESNESGTRVQTMGSVNL